MDLNNIKCEVRAKLKQITIANDLPYEERHFILSVDTENTYWIGIPRVAQDGIVLCPSMSLFVPSNNVPVKQYC